MESSVSRGRCVRRESSVRSSRSVVSRGSRVVSRGSRVVSRGSRVVSSGSLCVVSRGSRVVSRGRWCSVVGRVSLCVVVNILVGFAIGAFGMYIGGREGRQG